MSEWPTKTIDELKADKKHALAMGPFGSNIKAENFVSKGIPIIKGGNLTGPFLVEDKFDYLTEEKAGDLIASNACRGDIVITHRGTIGQVGLIPENSKHERYVVSQSQLKLSFDTDKINPYFVYYYLRSPNGQHALLLNASQVGVPALAQALTSVRKIEIPYPPKSVQDKIVDVILTIDNKISLNQRMNETLEAMSKALFKSWFVDFDPVRAKLEGRKPEGMTAATAALFPAAFNDDGLPEGWEMRPLGEYVTVKRGGSPRPIHDYLASQGLPWVKISDASACTSPYLMETKQFIKEAGLKKTVLLKRGSLILSNSATPGLPRFIDLDACIHDGWLYFPEKKILNDYYLYHLFLILKEVLISQGNGSVFTNLKTDILKNQPVVIPNGKIIEVFEKAIAPVFERILLNERQNQTLSNLRDALLPKLISGELRIDEAQGKQGN